MADRSSKRSFDEVSPDVDEPLKITSKPKNTLEKLTLKDLCGEIFLEIFQYLHPLDLLCSLTNLFPYLDALIMPYTHTLDLRLTSKSCFQYLTELFQPYLTGRLRILHLSNAHTFDQISEIFYKFDWSKINQLESLKFDSIQSNELWKYFHDIHPLLKHLWRLGLTFDEDDKRSEKLLLDHIFIPTAQCITNCFIIGITFHLNQLIKSKPNENLKELTLTLATIDDLLILFRHVPRLEILICTILDSTFKGSIDSIPSLPLLHSLTLTLEKAILFRNFQKILVPQIKIKQLSLIAIFCEENSSSIASEEIGGLILEKFFRTFSQLIKLRFYFRHMHNARTNVKPDHLYLFSFTSHFWLDRNIRVLTHFSLASQQRCVYTLPFLFDTFDITDDINTFFHNPNRYHYPQVRHLSLSSRSILTEHIYSSMILKFFPNLRTITLTARPLQESTSKTLNKHQWILQRSGSETSSTEDFPLVYILNNRKSKHWYFRTLDVTHADQKLFANTSKRVRQLTIYEMTEQQTVPLTYFFPWINVLVLHVNTLAWFSSSNGWLSRLFMHMNSLISLTVYYPKHLNDQKLQDALVNRLLAIKKHFFIKCNNGVLNIWC